MGLKNINNSAEQPRRGIERVYYNAWKRTKPGSRAYAIFKRLAAEELAAIRRTVQSKRCSSCKVVRPVPVEFALSPTGSWGYDNYCKTCRRERIKERRRKND